MRITFVSICYFPEGSRTFTLTEIKYIQPRMYKKEKNEESLKCSEVEGDRSLPGGIRVRILQELDVMAFWYWILDVVIF